MLGSVKQRGASVDRDASIVTGLMYMMIIGSATLAPFCFRIGGRTAQIAFASHSQFAV